MTEANTSSTVETVGTTLDGETLPEDDDPHHQPESAEERDKSSIYPLELRVGFHGRFKDNGRVFPAPVVETPHGKTQLPSSRFKKIRKSLKEAFDLSAPPIGYVGTVTVTETDHHIHVDAPDERDTKPYAEWILENIYKIISRIPAEAYSKEQSTISAADVNNIEDHALDALPGELVVVGGECHNCGNTVRESRYMVEEQEQAHAMCDCGIGTSYPRVSETTIEESGKSDD